MRFNEVQNNNLAFVFGRFNPPTAGHGKLLDKLASVNSNYKIYASQKQDKKSNPLPYDRKLTFLSMQFPKHTKGIVVDNSIKTIIDVMKSIQEQGIKNVTMVAGSDRVDAFQKLLNDYNGKEYKFDSINVVSAGERDPDAEGTAGVSASKARQAAMQGDYESFKKMISSTNEKLSKAMYDEVRQGMGVQEEAAGVGIVTKQNATKDVPVGGEYMNVKKLGLDKKRKKK